MKIAILGFFLVIASANLCGAAKENFDEFLLNRIKQYEEICNRPDLTQIDRALCFGKLDSYLDCWERLHPPD